MTRLTKHEKIKVGCGAAAIVILIVLALVGRFANLPWPHINLFGLNIGGGSVTTEPYEQEQAFPASEIQHVEVNWLGDDIRVIPAQDDQITVTEKIDKGVARKLAQPATFDLAHGTLRIESDGLNADLSDVNSKSGSGKYLTIAIPVGDYTLDELSLDGMSDTVQIDGVTLGDLSLDGMVGDVTMEGTLTGTLSGGGMTGDLDFTLTGAVPRLIELDGMVGDTKLALPAGTGFTAETDGLAGDITSDLPAERIGDGLRYGDGAVRISVSGMAGDLHISEA